MAYPERFLFGFAYHRVGLARRWKPSGSTLRRLDPDYAWTGSEVLLSFQTDRIVWIDVAAEAATGQDISELSRGCEERADAEFRRLFPGEELTDSL